MEIWEAPRQTGPAPGHHKRHHQKDKHAPSRPEAAFCTFQNKLAIGLKVSSPSTAVRRIEVNTLTPINSSTCWQRKKTRPAKPERFSGTTPRRQAALFGAGGRDRVIDAGRRPLRVSQHSKRSHGHDSSKPQNWQIS